MAILFKILDQTDIGAPSLISMYLLTNETRVSFVDVKQGLFYQVVTYYPTWEILSPVEAQDNLTFYYR